MIPAAWKDRLRRDGWILAALAACVGACLLMGPPPEPTAEDHIGSVLSAMAGAGRTEIAIYYNAQDVPCGALVLADGADDVALRLQMTRAVSALLGLDPAAVVVYPMQPD